MKTARIFLAGMYLYLVLSILAPLSVLLLGWDGESPPPAAAALLCAYLAAAVLAALLGWLYVVMGLVASHQRHMGRLVTGWQTIKLRSIPFRVLNLIWSFTACGLFFLPSRVIHLPLLVLPLCLDALFVFQSGCLGIALLRTMRRHGDGPSCLHYLGQLLPAADILSTLFLLRVLQVDNIN